MAQTEAVLVRKFEALAEPDRAIAITNADECEMFAQELEIATGLEREVIAWYREPKAAAHRAWKLICDREREYLEKVRAFTAPRRDAIATYQGEQRRLREAAERALAEEARKRRDAIAKEQAKELRAAGLKEEAKQVVAAAKAAPPPAVTIPQRAPSEKVHTILGPWQWELVDIAKMDERFKVPNAKEIGARVRAMGVEAEKHVGGIRVFREEVTRVES